MQNYAAPTTPPGFPPPPMTTPMTIPPGANALLDAQRVRLEQLRGSVDLTGLAPDVRGGLMRGMEIESIVGLNDINPDFTPAAQSSQQTRLTIGS